MKVNRKGFSLLEIMVTISIMFLVTPLLMNLINDIQKNSSSSIASSVQRSRDSSGIARIGRIINSNTKFIARDYGEAPPTGTTIGIPSSVSQFYLKTIALPTTFVSGGVGKTYTPLALTSRVLPVYDPDGTFSPENTDTTLFTHPFTTSNVGNSLMCITVEDYLTYPYNSSGDYLPTSPLKRRFPLYQIHYFFLAKASGSEFQKRVSTVSSVDQKLISLFEWKSQYFFDYNDLNNFVTCGSGSCLSCGFGTSCWINPSNSSILDSLKANINTNVKPDLIKNIPIAGVLKQSESAYAANTPIVFPISSGSIVGSKLTGTQYTGASLATSIPMQNIENILRYPSSRDMAYGIAANNFSSANAGNYKASQENRVPFFKFTDNLYTATDGFPHGFEVMLSGTAGSTKSFIKMMTLASGYGTYSYNSSMTTFQGKN